MISFCGFFVSLASEVHQYPYASSMEGVGSLQQEANEQDEKEPQAVPTAEEDSTSATLPPLPALYGDDEEGDGEADEDIEEVPKQQGVATRPIQECS